MLRNLLILSLCVVTITANGDFSILNSPKAISFKGSEPISSQNVAEVLNAALGYPVSENAQWSGMIVNDPFNMPKSVVAVAVEGVSSLGLSANSKTFELEGPSRSNDFDSLTEVLQEDSVAACNMDFNKFDEAVISFRQCFGDLAVPGIAETQFLNPDLYASDKHFLQSLAFINAASEKLNSNTKMFVTVSLESIDKSHGQKSEAMSEAKKLVSKAISNLSASAQKASDNVLVVVMTNQEVSSRQKRDTPDAKDNFNLAEYYSEDYPVIFNIILWFMVTFGLSLLAICYAIGAMDPGRDSIIYRMTSTRMKKDN